MAQFHSLTGCCARKPRPCLFRPALRRQRAAPDAAARPRVRGSAALRVTTAAASGGAQGRRRARRSGAGGAARSRSAARLTVRTLPLISGGQEPYKVAPSAAFRGVCALVQNLSAGLRARSLSPVNSWRPHGPWPARLLCPEHFPGREDRRGWPFPSPGGSSHTSPLKLPLAPERSDTGQEAPCGEPTPEAW